MDFGQRMPVAVFTFIPDLVVLKNNSNQEVEPRDIHVGCISNSCVDPRHRVTHSVGLHTHYSPNSRRRRIFLGSNLVSVAFSTSVYSDAFCKTQRRGMNREGFLTSIIQVGVALAAMGGHS